MNTRTALHLGLALMTLGAIQSSAQVLMTTVTNNNYTYTQNFDSLPTQSGTTRTTNVWANNVTLAGWYCNGSNAAPAIFGTGGSCTNILGDSGGASAGAFYSFGTNGVNPVSERAMGSILANTFSPSGTPGLAYGIRFTNDTDVALTNFVITYTGEQWRYGGATVAQPLYFAYRVDSSAIADADFSSINSWTTVAALQFNSPIISGSTRGLDGNNSANRTVLTATITGLIVSPGQELFFRWLDINDSGNDHAIAIDDITITCTNIVPPAPSAPSFIQDPSSQTLREGDTLASSVTVGGTQPIGIYWYTIESGVTNYVGAQNPQTIYNYVNTNQTGNKFFAVASNSVNVTTSSVATLTVTSSVPISATIAYLRTLRNPTTWAVTDMTNLYTIEGVVTTPGLLAPPLQSYFVQDATGGIDVFNRDGAFPMPSVGDHVKITGPLFNFNGLLELNLTNANPSHHVEIVSSGNALPTPAAFSFADASNPTLMENSIEGTLVYVTDVFLGWTNASPFLSAGGTIFMTNTSGGRFNISLPSDPLGDMVNKTLQSPPFARSVAGVISQNAGGVPTNAYNLVVFAYTNIIWTNNVAISTPITTSVVDGTNQIVSWPVKLMSLQTSTNLSTGPWETIPGATSPYTNDLSTNPAAFFRVVYP